MENPFAIKKEEFMRPDLDLGNMPAVVIPAYAIDILSKDGIVLNVLARLLMLLAKNKVKGDFKVIHPLGDFADDLNRDKRIVKKALERLHALNIIFYKSSEELRSRSFEAFIHVDPKMWKLDETGDSSNE